MTSLSSHPLRPTYHRPRGFSFIEVLFALAVLAVGFIMIAAIFPVAIRQTEATVDATAAQTIADHATQSILAVATSADLPDTGGRISRLPAPVLQRLTGSLIYPSDPRYAFTAAYERTGSNDPTVYLYVLRSREESTFDHAKFVAMEDAASQPKDLSGTIPTATFWNDITYNGVRYDGIEPGSIPPTVMNRLVGQGATASGMSIQIAPAIPSLRKVSTIGKLIDSADAAGPLFLLPSNTVDGPTVSEVSSVPVAFYPGHVSAFEPQDVPISIQFGQAVGDYADPYTQTEANTIRFWDDLGKVLAAPGITLLLADNNPKAMYYRNSAGGFAPGGSRATDPDATQENDRRASQPLANGTLIRLGQRVDVGNNNVYVFEIASITDRSGNLIEITGPHQNVEPYSGNAGILSSPSDTDPELPRALIVGPPLEKPWLVWEKDTNKYKAAPPLDLAILPITLQGLN